MSAKVYVVCAIDTEGPIVDPRNPEILDTWGRVDHLVGKMTDKAFRMRYPDSSGEGLKYSWFILHLTGFKTNPFKRPMGYCEVFDHYLRVHAKTIVENQDGMYWHYHQPAPSGVGNEWCRDWTHCTEYHQVLSHWILDRKFFPTCFRAGGRIEDDDLSNWIEQWIPFDYSNNSGLVNWDKRESDGKKLGDVCDWRRASQEWFPYHPSAQDYQTVGLQKRFMFRCPDLNSPVHVLTDEEISRAFMQAQTGKNAVLAFFEHDRRDNVIGSLENVCGRLQKIAAQFPAVKWHYKNAQEAAQEVLGLTKKDQILFYMQPRNKNRLFITAEGPLFGSFPYVCLKRADSYQEVPLHAVGQQKWLSGYLDLRMVERIGVAANSVNGNSFVEVFKGNSFNNITKEMEGLR